MPGAVIDLAKLHIRAGQDSLMKLNPRLVDEINGGLGENPQSGNQRKKFTTNILKMLIIVDFDHDNKTLRPGAV